MYVCVCICVCVRVMVLCVCACVRACAYLSVSGCVCVCFMYIYNISDEHGRGRAARLLLPWRSIGLSSPSTLLSWLCKEVVFHSPVFSSTDRDNGQGQGRSYVVEHYSKGGNHPAVV